MRARFLGPCAALATALACCGGDGHLGGRGARAGGSTEGAKVIDVGSMDRATGTVALCSGKEPTGFLAELITRFNATFAERGVKARLVDFPAETDEQRNQFVQRQEARSAECDVFTADVIWTAEFAVQKWLYDLSPYLARRKREFIAPTLETVSYDGKRWGVPLVTDTAFLYFRTDRIARAPTTWQQVYQEAETSGGIVYQGEAYEGLTCDFLELAFAAGGKVLSDDGKQSQINSPQNLRALQFMVDGIEDGAAPKAVTTYAEEESRRAFESGGYAFMRNWPYAYSLGKMSSAIKGRFAVAPLPRFAGGGRAGILGGHNLVISRFSKSPGAALRFIDFATGPEIERMAAAKYSEAPVLVATYDDPAVKNARPFTATLKRAVLQAKSRPVSPVYPQVSQAIYKNVNAALSRQVTPQDALQRADDQINRALATF
jgi:multiple sugar transport system substrate-binding protein